MAYMNSRTFISVLLLVGICIPFFSMPNAHSQSNATSTTMTIQQPPPGGCAMLPLAFSAHANDIITGTFQSDVSISFFILSLNDFNALQDCRLSSSARPLFIQENIAGSNNPYRTRLIPADGTYYFVFTFINSNPHQLLTGYATVALSFPASVNLTVPGASSTMVSSNLIEMTTALSLSTSTTISPSTSISTSALATVRIAETVQAQWYADIAQPYMILGGIGATIVIVFIVVLVMMRRRGRVTPAPTRPAAPTSTQATPPPTQLVTPTAPPPATLPPPPVTQPTTPVTPVQRTRRKSKLRAPSQPTTPITSVPPSPISSLAPPPGMKFCIFCRQLIPMNARYCTNINCGKPQH